MKYGGNYAYKKITLCFYFLRKAGSCIHKNENVK